MRCYYSIRTVHYENTKCFTELKKDLAALRTKINVVTSYLNPSFMCTSKSKNAEGSTLGVLQHDSPILEMPKSDWLILGLAQFDWSVLMSLNLIGQF